MNTRTLGTVAAAVAAIGLIGAAPADAKKKRISRGTNPAGPQYFVLGGGGAEAGPVMDEADAEEVRDALRKKKDSGARAVKNARLGGKYFEAKSGAAAGVGVKAVAGKTFRLVDGVWVDTAIKAGAEYVIADVKYLGTTYDELLDDETLARYLSVGARVHVLHEGKLYRIAG